MLLTVWNAAVRCPDENLVLRFKISEDAIEYNCVRSTRLKELHAHVTEQVINAFRRAGLVRTNAKTQWNVRWGRHLPAEEYKLLKPFQKLNHFPVSALLT